MCCLWRTKLKDPGFKSECKNRRRLRNDITGLPTMTSSKISNRPLLLLFAWCRTEIHTKGENTHFHNTGTEAMNKWQEWTDVPVTEVMQFTHLKQYIRLSFGFSSGSIHPERNLPSRCFQPSPTTSTATATSGGDRSNVELHSHYHTFELLTFFSLTVLEMGAGGEIVPA